MEKITLDAHPSVIIINGGEDFLFSVYDNTYPRETYRLSANLTGGNPLPTDICPENVLIRELVEEFNPNHEIEKQYVGKVDWASKEKIRYIRGKLLEKMTPLQDFLVIQTGEIKGGNKPYHAIYSVFLTELESKVIENIKEDISKNKNLTTEGNLGIYTLKQLEEHPRKEFGTAHATGHILNYEFNSRIPCPKKISVEGIGFIRSSFREYTNDFIYNSENLQKASNAEDFIK